MESNSDKAMRDKLQGVEMPFDPAAWEQMEAMLAKKEKKRGFFWLWFGTGMAALLLLTGVGAYLAMHGESDKQIALAKEQTSVNNEQGNTAGNGQGVASMQKAIGNQEGDEGTGSTQLTKASNKIGNAAGSTQLNKAGKIVSSSQGNAVSNKGESNSISKAGNVNNNARNETNRNIISGQQTRATLAENRANKQGRKQSAKNSAALTNNQQPTTGNRRASTRNLPPVTSNSLLTDFNGKPISTSIAGATGTEVVNADKYWLTYLNPAEEEYSPAKNESSDKLPEKMRSKVFQYSMGALVNVSGSMVKNGLADTSKGVTMGPAPSFMIGFTHDFLFARRFAITNSILYSQTSFTVKRPWTLSFTESPLDFTCRISEVAIPIGIKVYPVVTPKFRFYLSVGVINHIKLSETFSYTTLPIADTTIPNLAADVKNTYPTQTIFDGAGNGAVETTDASFNAGTTTTTTTVVVNTNEFSINNAKRYYASFYAGAGVEGTIKNRWILFAEPSFNMSLQKIGIQERRKYNVGANLGFRYQF